MEKEQRLAVVPLAEGGQRTAARLASALPADTLTRAEAVARWQDYDAFVFVGAMGIVVRTVGPLLRDKHTDPAVVQTDALGLHVVSVAGGHVGGANELTRHVAALLDADPVVSTQSDLQDDLWPLDLLARRFGWHVASAQMNEPIALFVRRRPTALWLPHEDTGTRWMRRNLPKHVTVVEAPPRAGEGYELLIAVSPQRPATDLPTVCYVPRCLHAGIGLAHEAGPVADLLDEMDAAVGQAGFYPEAVADYASIDVKRDEPVMEALRERGEVLFYTAEELAAVEVPHPSDTVLRHVGTPSVAEAAALCPPFRRLVLPKVKGEKWTLALAADVPHGHIEIVGAGPGDPDLVSVRGRRLLEAADLILYAGSLVPRALTECAKPGCVVRSSADMTLEEQCALMKEHYDRGQLVVRLHTGDPSIFGAIEEQMAYFDAERMDYHITPGISSFLAAAAELRSQFTIPGRVQTIILTRGEGRTPMPEREKLHLLARSRSTMCIFLSASIVDEVERELLTEYAPDTPVAVCHHLTWPDQAIYRGQLSELARLVHDHRLTLTTMLVVGEAIDNRRGQSLLYDKTFHHLFR